MIRAAAAVWLIAALGACDQPDSAAPPPAAAPSAPAVPLAAPVAAPAIPSVETSRDPAVVLLGWAKAVSLKDWPAAYAYWGAHGTASAMTLAQFTALWGTLNDPEVLVRPGQLEGAAGSSFYTASVTVIDGARRIEGEVVLRRVNDVPGASAESLRWHIERSTLRP